MIMRPPHTDPTAARPPDRAVIQSSTRPLRLVIALESPISMRAFRRAVRVLCERWGGARSLIVPLAGANSIDDTWMGALRALDPDAVFVQNSTPTSRARIRGQLNAMRATPLEVSDFTSALDFGAGWSPMERATAEPEQLVSGGAQRLNNATAVEIAVLGLAGSRASETTAPEQVSPRDMREAARGPSVVQGTPVSAASFGIPGSAARRPVWWVPFFWHESNDIDVALALWNLRAVTGAIGHGGLPELKDVLARVPPRATGSRIEIVSLGPLPKRAKTAVASIVARGAKVTLYRDYRWPRRPNRGFVFGYGAEVDDALIVDGVFEIPLRPPRNMRPDAATETFGRAGAYAIEMDIELPRHGGKRTSLPPRSGLRNLATRVAVERLPQQLSGLAVQSRVLSDGSTALIARTVRFAKSARLRVPSLTEAMTSLGAPVSFALSDKGLYSRWISGRMGGLGGIHELMTDPRSEVLMAEFRVRHDGRRIEGGYRRSLTADEMRAVFTEARKRKALPNRIRGGWTDEDWLAAWLASLVGAGVLQLGVRVRCEECRQGSFITIGNVGQTFACPRCENVESTPAMPHLGYKLAEAAHLFLEHHSDLDALALAALHRRAEIGFSYDFEHDVTWSAGSQNEFDFCAVIDGRLMVGESKTGGSLDERSAKVLKRVARTLQPDGVVIASDNECQGGCGEDCGAPRDLWDTSDTALASGGGALGPRDHMLALRADLAAAGTKVIVLCRGDLYGPFLPVLQRTIFL